MNKREWMLQAALAALNGGLRLDPLDLTVAHFGVAYDAICAASPEMPQEGAWVEHDGDVNTAPHVDNITEVVFRDGSIDTGPAGDFVWDHHGEYGDIVRWRYA